MSERQAKRQRRAERNAAKRQQQASARTHRDTSSHLPSEHPSSVASSHLAIALSAAVPLHVLGLYERQGPDEKDLETARRVGTVLASKGDVLLFGSRIKGEVADIFNQTAEAIGVLSFAPGSVTCFGHHFDAQEILSGFFGAQTGEQYCQQVRETPLTAQQEQRNPHNDDMY